MYREYYSVLNKEIEEVSNNVFIKIEEDIRKALAELDGIKGITEVDYAKKYLNDLCDKL
jgi:hypothetical protein